jgi:L-fuculose-phosphate aldolase
MHGHASIRIPGTDRILINSRLVSRREVAVNSIVEVDLEGNPIDAGQEPPSETPIHTEVYKKRSDVHAIVHAHPHYASVLTIAGQRILPVYGIGAFIGEVPVYEDPDLVNTKEKGERMARALGNARIVMIQSHGAVVTGSSIQEAFAATINLEENSKKQVEALQITPTIKVFTAEEAERVGKSNWNPKTVMKTWDYFESDARINGRLEGVENANACAPR